MAEAESAYEGFFGNFRMTTVKQNREDWERQYSSNAWDSLSSAAEFAHYTLVAAYVQRHKRPATLLDIGCGSGVLLKYLDLGLVNQYTGLDIAQSALDRITPKRANDRYICSSLEAYEPDATWDVILFNEVLYYTHYPVEMFRKFERCLKPDGFYVISMFKKRNPLAYNNQCLRKVRKYLMQGTFEVIGQVEVCQLARRSTWQILTVKSRGVVMERATCPAARS